VPYDTLDELPTIQNPKNIEAAPSIEFLGWNPLDAAETYNPTFKLPFTLLPISLFWQSQTGQSENFQLSLEVKDSNNETIYQKYYPLAYGIYPTTEWERGKTIKTNYWFLIPDSITDKNNIVSLNLVRLKEDRSYLGLNGLLSATMKNVEYEEVGEEIEIPLL